jgi:hypothetical protein
MLVNEIILYYDARSKKHQITHFMFKNTHLPENRAVNEICETILLSQASHNDKMAHARCMLDT